MHALRRLTGETNAKNLCTGRLDKDVRAPLKAHQELLNAATTYLDASEISSVWRDGQGFNVKKAILKLAMLAGAKILLRLVHRVVGEAALRRLDTPAVLNRFAFGELKEWVVRNRAKRKGLGIPPISTFYPNTRNCRPRHPSTLEERPTSRRSK